MYTQHRLAKKYSWYGWFVCSLAALFYCYEYLLRIEPSVMAQQLRLYFGHLTAGDLGKLISLYYWAYAPMQAIVGVLTDRFGPKRTLTLAIALCAFGTYLFGATSIVAVAAVGRFLIGCGSAFAFVGVLKLAAMWLPEKYFAFFVGLTTALGMLGAIVGDLGMTWIVLHFGWHRVLQLSVAVGIILIPLFYFFVHEKIIQKPKHSPKASMGYFFQHFFRLLRNPQLIMAGVIGCLLYLSLSAFGEMWGIPFLQKVYPGRHMGASGMNAMVFWGWLVGAPLASWISMWLRSRRKALIAGSIAATVIFSVILLFPTMSHYLMAVLLFLFGLFCSMQVLCFVIARAYVTAELAATAVGVINMLVMVSGMLLQPLISKILDWTWSGQMLGQLRIYTLHDYQMAMLALPVALLISAVMGFFLKENYGKVLHGG